MIFITLLFLHAFAASQMEFWEVFEQNDLKSFKTWCKKSHKKSDFDLAKSLEIDEDVYRERLKEKQIPKPKKETTVEETLDFKKNDLSEKLKQSALPQDQKKVLESVLRNPGSLVARAILYNEKSRNFWTNDIWKSGFATYGYDVLQGVKILEHAREVKDFESILRQNQQGPHNVVLQILEKVESLNSPFFLNKVAIAQPASSTNRLLEIMQRPSELYESGRSLLLCTKHIDGEHNRKARDHQRIYVTLYQDSKAKSPIAQGEFLENEFVQISARQNHEADKETQKLFRDIETELADIWQDQGMQRIERAREIRSLQDFRIFMRSEKQSDIEVDIDEDVRSEIIDYVILQKNTKATDFLMKYFSNQEDLEALSLMFKAFEIVNDQDNQQKMKNMSPSLQSYLDTKDSQEFCLFP